jgi:hypothetical protein
MDRRPLLALAASLPLLLPAASAGADHVNTLALEFAAPSFGAGFAGESPPQSGLLHSGELCEGDPLYGLSFELRVARHVGIRMGFLRGDLALRGSTTCTPAPCEFTIGSSMVIITEANWSVSDSASFSLPFIEIPVSGRVSPRVEVFAGPTIAWPALDDVSAPPPNGLDLRVDTGSPAYGAHLGFTVDLDLRQRWAAGVVARFVPLEVDLSVGHPFVPVLEERFAFEDDLLSVSVMLGRRFGN